MRAVNLLPRDAAGAGGPMPSLRRAAPVAGAALVPIVAVALVAAGYRESRSLVSSRTAQLAALQAQAKPAASARESAAGDGEIAAARAARFAALEAATSGAVHWDVALGQLARIVPAGVWLTSLQAAAPSAAAAAPSSSSAGGASNGFSIGGYASTEDGVASLLARLELLPWLSQVKLVSTAATTIGTRPVVQFQASAVVAAPAGGATP